MSTHENENNLVSTYIEIQDATGDTKIELRWDPNNEEEVIKMEQTFISLKEKGYLIVEVTNFLGIFKRVKAVEEFHKRMSSLIATGDSIDLPISEVELVNSKEQEYKEEKYKLFVPGQDIIDTKPTTRYRALAPIGGG